MNMNVFIWSLLGCQYSAVVVMIVMWIARE